MVLGVQFMVQGGAEETQGNRKEEGFATVRRLASEVGCSLPSQDVQARVEVHQCQPDAERQPEGHHVRAWRYPRCEGQEQEIDDKIRVRTNWVHGSWPHNPLGFGLRQIWVTFHTKTSHDEGQKVRQEWNRERWHNHTCREEDRLKLLLEHVGAGIDADRVKLLRQMQIEIFWAQGSRVVRVVDPFEHQVDLAHARSTIYHNCKDLPPKT
mmetsp:Transcript_16919/g.45857  ORF Transcript_16919/g.45857 Transcript_16919/m.45857 type:complete len:210 (+) Transcript_16919:511-1140(+)